LNDIGQFKVVKIRISKIQPAKDQTLDETLAENSFDVGNAFVFGGNDTLAYD
jgi:hypothetical protein